MRLGRPARPAEERFHEKYVIDPSGCWVWQGALTKGYGHIHNGTKQAKAHRYAYELLVGSIPEGLVIDHLCRNRACVNPEHLEPVPQRINVLRGESFAAVYAVATHCAKGHEFTSENTYVRKDGRRQCLRCLRSNTIETARKARQRDPESVRAKDRERQRRYRERRSKLAEDVTTRDKNGASG